MPAKATETLKAHGIDDVVQLFFLLVQEATAEAMCRLLDLDEDSYGHLMAELAAMDIDLELLSVPTYPTGLFVDRAGEVDDDSD